MYEADVTNPADCQGMVETVRSRYGRLDILVNNVGIRGPGAVVEVKAEDWDRGADVNLKSMMLTSKYAIPEMITWRRRHRQPLVHCRPAGGQRWRELPYAVSKGVSLR